MPLDKLKNLTAEQKAKLEATLKEFDVMVDEITTADEKRVAAEKTATDAAAALEVVQKDWQEAYSEFEKVSNDSQSSQKEVLKAKAELEQAKREKLEAESKLREALGRKQTEIDTSKFVTAEQLEAQRKRDAASQTAYWGDTLDAVADVERVTKQRISPKTLIQEAIAANKTPLAYAEEKYKLSEERAKQAKEVHDKELADERKKGREEAFAEMANPHTRPLEDSKSPFYVAKSDQDAAAGQPWDENGVLRDDPLELHLKSDPDLADKFADSVIKRIQ
jgi:hypothetical protein